MTIEYDEGDSSVKIAEDVPMREQSQGEYDAWYAGHFFYTAYANAAEALRDEAKRAFVRGCDEIAFLLRERADALEEQGRLEANEWEKNHRPK